MARLSPVSSVKRKRIPVASAEASTSLMAENVRVAESEIISIQNELPNTVGETQVKARRSVHRKLRILAFLYPFFKKSADSMRSLAMR